MFRFCSARISSIFRNEFGGNAKFCSGSSIFDGGVEKAMLLRCNNVVSSELVLISDVTSDTISGGSQTTQYF